MVNSEGLKEKLISSEGGTALMPLDKYPFSEKYGWIQDKYGLTWQLILSHEAVQKHNCPLTFVCREYMWKS